MQPQGQRPPDNGTTVATTGPVLQGSQGSLPNARDAVIPMHPFSGLLSVAVEQNWRVEEVFRGFEFDRSGQPLPGQRINFLQAREILLRASHRGGDRTAALSGSRKSLANLGVIGLGILAHGSLGEGLKFGVEFQRLAGSMLDVRLQTHGDEVSLVAGDLFGDEETRSFLQTDHLLTAVNALTHLRTRGFGVRRIELEGELAAGLAARLEHEFGCPVTGHAEVARAVFDAGQLAAHCRTTTARPRRWRARSASANSRRWVWHPRRTACAPICSARAATCAHRPRWPPRSASAHAR